MFKGGGYLFYSCVVCLLFVFNSSLSAQEQSANPQQVLDWQKSAQDCVTQGNTAQAVENYLKIQQNFPDTDYAVDAQKCVVTTYLWSNQADNAMAAIAELTKTYSQHPDYVVQMEEIIDRLADTNHPAEAKGVCESLLARFPDDPRMIWIIQRKARSEVWMKRPDLADATVKTMQKKYDGHPSYADVMSWMAYEYYRAGLYPRAGELYNAILSLNPADGVQLRCKAGIALVCLGQGDTAGISRAMEQVKNSIQSCRDSIRIEDVAEMVRLTDTDQTAAAKEVCGALFSRFPDDPWMIWVLQRKARSEMMMRQGDSADATVKIMQQKYASHPEYAKVTRLTACEYIAGRVSILVRWSCTMLY
jgi:tetratricopeptide (TPR) repeat protein